MLSRLFRFATRPVLRALGVVCLFVSPLTAGAVPASAIVEPQVSLVPETAWSFDSPVSTPYVTYFPEAVDSPVASPTFVASPFAETVAPSFVPSPSGTTAPSEVPTSIPTGSPSPVCDPSSVPGKPVSELVPLLIDDCYEIRMAAKDELIKLFQDTFADSGAANFSNTSFAHEFFGIAETFLTTTGFDLELLRRVQAITADGSVSWKLELWLMCVGPAPAALYIGTQEAQGTAARTLVGDGKALVSELNAKFGDLTTDLADIKKVIELKGFDSMTTDGVGTVTHRATGLSYSLQFGIESGLMEDSGFRRFRISYSKSLQLQLDDIYPRPARTLMALWGRMRASAIQDRTIEVPIYVEDTSVEGSSSLPAAGSVFSTGTAGGSVRISVIAQVPAAPPTPEIDENDMPESTPSDVPTAEPSAISTVELTATRAAPPPPRMEYRTFSLESYFDYVTRDLFVSPPEE